MNIIPEITENSRIDAAKWAQEAAVISNLISIRDIGFTISLVAIAYKLLCYNNFSSLSCILAFILISKAQTNLMLISHEAMHYLLFTNRKLNDLVGMLCYASTGIGFYQARGIHADHHQHLLTELDEELDRQIAEPSRKNFIIHLVAPFFGKYLIHRILQLTGKTYKRRSKPQAKMTVYKSRADNLSVYGFSICLFVALTLVDWRLYIFFWILPLITITSFFYGAKGFLDHFRFPDEPEGLLYSYKLYWIDRIFFPAQQALHAEHHTYPYVPYHKLSKLHDIVSVMPNVRFRSGYWASLVNYFVRVREFNDKQHAA